MNLAQLQAFVPSGVIFPYAGASAPAGYLLCNGAAVSRTTYALLFAAIGVTYGAGDGSTTFNVPDYRGRAITGADDMGSGGAAGRLTNASMNSTLKGGTGGTESITLNTTQIPAHTHIASVTDPGHNHSYETVAVSTAGAGATNPAGGQTAASTDPSVTGITVSNANAGGGGSHLNVQPTLLVTVIIKQ